MSAIEVPKRFFWRRAGAFIVECALLSIFFGLLAAVVQPLSPIKVSAPGLLAFQSCQSPPQNLSGADPDKILPLEDGETRTLTFCRISHMGLTEHNEVRIGAVKKSGNVTYRRNISYPSDDTGKPISLVPFGALLMLFGPFIVAALYGAGGQSPGKRLFGLQVTRSGSQPANGSTARRRELLKWIPMMIFGLVALVSSIAPFSGHATSMIAGALAQGSILWFVIAISALSLACFVYWFFPFLRWRGQTFYDKWLQLYVDRRAGESSAESTTD